jgi:hypothetical protein
MVQMWYGRTSDEKDEEGVKLEEEEETALHLVELNCIIIYIEVWILWTTFTLYNICFLIYT